MSKGGDQVQETPAQRAMAEHAVQLMADYEKRWLPVQQHLAKSIQAEGAPNSAARREAAGKAATDTNIAFGRAQGQLEKQLSNTGAAPGSSKANLAITGLGSDLAKSEGLSTTISDQQIDDAYTQGLGALMSIGRGKAANVSNSLASQANQSALQARADASASLSEHQGQGALVGQLAGYGLQSALAPGPNFVTPGAGGAYANPTTGSGGMGIGWGNPTPNPLRGGV